MRPNPIHLILPAAIAICTPLATADLGSEGAAKAQQLFTKALSVPECAPTAEHECHAGCDEAYLAARQLGALLSKSTEAFDGVAPLFRTSFEQGGSAKDQALGLLASCGSDRCVALGDELFEAASPSFSEGQMLAFAEAGSEAITQRLAKLVKTKQTESALPAAWFALRGDALGKSTLQRALGAEVRADNAVEVLISGAALSALGDKEALKQARARVHAAVLGALDAGQLESARGMALAADVLAQPLTRAVEASARKDKQSEFRLSGVPEKLGWHIKRSSTELTDADAVFELIEKLTPLS